VIFLKIYISQGSVMTSLWYGGISANHIIANFPQSVPAKEFWKYVNIWTKVWFGGMFL